MSEATRKRARGHATPDPSEVGCEREFAGETSTPRGSRRRHRRNLGWGLLSFLGLLLLVITTLWWSNGGTPRSLPTHPYTAAHGDLLDHLERRYPLRVRLSGSGVSSEAEFHDEIASSLTFAGEEIGRRVSAEARIEREAAEPSTPESQAAAGARWLLNNSPSRAIAALQAARLRRPGDSRIVNDLAAAYLVRHVKEQRPLDLLEAIVLADKATQADSGIEPHFNLALALDTANLSGPALGAWQHYLRTDGRESAWTRIASQRLESLQDPNRGERWERVRPVLWESAVSRDVEGLRRIFEEFPERSRDEIEAWFFDSWSEAILAGDQIAAREVLTTIRSALEAGNRGLAVLGAAVAHLDRRDPLERKEVARGLREFWQAKAAVERFQGANAHEPAKTALSRLQQAGSPLEGRALALVALCQYQDGSYREAAANALAAYEAALEVSDVQTVAQSLQILGVMASIENRFGDALDRYQEALTLSRELGWNTDAAGPEGLIGEVLRLLGDDESAWRHRLSALARSEASYKGWVRFRLLLDGTAALLPDSPDAARYFADELVRVAELVDTPTTWIIALRQRSEVIALLGQRRQAIEDLETAEHWIDRLPDRQLAEMLLGNVLRTRGELLLTSRPREALSALDRALDLFRRTDFEFGIPWALRTRSVAHRALGDTERAASDLQMAIRKLEARVSTISDPKLRAEFSEEVRETYDEILALHLSSGQGGLALEYAARSHWSLVESASKLGAPQAIADLRLPYGTVVISYRALDDRLVIWALRKDRMLLKEVPIDNSELRDRVEDYRRSIRWDTQHESLARAMHEVLLRPVAPALERVKEIIVVPDRFLGRVPFAALIDAQTGHALLEDFTVSLSPSIQAVEDAAGRADRLGPNSSVLAVASSASGYRASTGSLPLAVVELERIAERFPRTTQLLGEEASEARLLEEAPRYEILHLAGHALSNEGNPLLASLSLAPYGQSDGRLFAHEILRARLASVRLAVLSACGTADMGGGNASLALALTEAGIPTVLASLWDVRDRPPAALFDKFYAKLSNGEDPIAALRAAQLELRASPDPELNRPESWAAFVAIRDGRRF